MTGSKANSQTINAGVIRHLLLDRYDIGPKSNAGEGLPPRHAMFFELNNGTGSNGGRRFIDAFLWDLWPSGGLTRRAFEIKVSRQDFLSELKKPEKRMWAMEISHEFWFVCAPGICDKSEVPEGCGLMVVTGKGDKLRVLVHAKHREPRDLTMVEMASFARKSSPYVHNKDMKYLYNGCEIDSRTLDAMVQQKMDSEVEQRIYDSVESAINDKMTVVGELLDVYAECIRESGFKPPVWMSSKHLRRIEDEQRYYISRPKKWAIDQLSPPGLQDLSKAKSDMAAIKLRMDEVLNNMSQIIEDVNNSGKNQ